MSKPYEKECNRCGQKISMSDELGKGWKPYNLDNSEHVCKSKNGTISSVPNNGNGNDLSVQVLLKKLETVGVKVDLNKLRNVSV